MIKFYNLKWCFVFTAAIAGAAVLLKPWRIGEVGIFQFAEYLFVQQIQILCCWMIHMYFIKKNTCIQPVSLRYAISNISGIIIGSLMIAFLSKIQNPLLDSDSADNARLFTVAGIIIRAFFLSSLTFIVAYLVYANTMLQASRLENEHLEQAHLKAQLLALQQQISPHFLFNSLSTLKTIVKDRPAKDFIIRLATVYRYVLNFNEHHLSELEDELVFIKSYIYILCQRFEESLEVTLNISPRHNKHKLPALTLQLLIENAIKHNNFSAEAPLKITIESLDTDTLSVTNNYQPKNSPAEGTGTGLKNIILRYKLLSTRPVEVIRSEEKFLVILPLLNA